MRWIETFRHGSFHIEGPEEHIHAHDDCLGFSDCFVNVAHGHVRVGPHAFFGKNVRLLTTGHDYTKFGRERIESTYTGRDCDIVIGEGVWVCDSAIIVGPCTIGAHAVIAAGAVVTGLVAPYALMRGNPAVQTKDVRWPDGPLGCCQWLSCPVEGCSKLREFISVGVLESDVHGVGAPACEQCGYAAL